MQPIVMHLDMNSYFASVAQQDNPQWRGRPLGVCEHLGGIIIAASREAKLWGIKTGTPVWEARRLYPKIILAHTQPKAYKSYIAKFIKLVSDYTGQVEQYSIDEVFIDATKACNVKKADSGQWLIDSDPFEEAVNIVKEIKRRMKIEVGDWLTCSVGVAENKLLAKIGSDLQKPDGLVVILPFSDVINPDDIAGPTLILSKAQLYHRLKLTDIPGIARRQEKNLNALGIKTLADLRDYPLSLLVARFGVQGYHLHRMGQLEASWKPKVELEEQIKSIGHMYTLPKEYREPKFFVPVLYKLSEMVARRLRKQGLMGDVIHFYLRDKGYQGFGQSKRLGFCLYDGREIFLQCMKIFESDAALSSLLYKGGEAASSHSSPSEQGGGGEIGFKLIGITVAGLRPFVNQLSLFGREEQRNRVSFALDKINDKYGDFTVCRVPILDAKDVFQDSVGFGRIKEK